MSTYYHQLYSQAIKSPETGYNQKSKINKQQSLKRLMNLLDRKQSTLPVASIKQYVNQSTKKKLFKHSIDQSDEGDQSIRLDNKNSDCGNMLRSYLFLPKVSQVTSLTRKKQIQSQKWGTVRGKIQQYIDQYVKHIEQNQILDQYEDHSALIQRAVKDIRKKVIEKMKKQQQQKQSAIKKIGKKQRQSETKSKKKIQKFNYYGKNSKSQINHQNSIAMNSKLSKKSSNSTPKQHSLQKIPNILHSKRRKNSYIQKQQIKKYKFDRSNTSKTFSNDIQHKNRITAHMNLYKLDMDRINKNMELRERQRRRSQRNFIKKIDLDSLYS